MSSTPEGKILKEICKHLRKNLFFFFRVNNTPQWDNRIGAYRSMGEFAIKGVPDIIVVADIGGFNVVLWVEVKHKTKQSPDQFFFQQRVERLNGFYAVVKSVEDFEKFYAKTVSTMQKRIQNKTISL